MGDASAVASEDGLSHLRHYPPQEIGGGPQILSAVRGIDGTLYFAANRSVLIFDGARWRRIHLATPRRLAVHPDGRIFVGCDGDFGFLMETLGVTGFVSLRERLPAAERPSGLIVGTEVVGETAYFVYRHRVVVLSGGELRSVVLDGPEIEAVTVFDGALYLIRQGRGPERFTPSGSAPLEPSLGSDRARVLAADHGDLLVGTDSGRLLRFRDDAFAPVSTRAEEILGGNPIWDLLPLDNGRLVVASRGSGLLVLEADGEVSSHLDPSKGLPGKEVYTAVEDLQGSLWLGTAKGIVRVSNSPFDLYNPAGDGPESVIALSRRDGNLYLGSLQGAYLLRPAAGIEPARFEKIEGMGSGVTSWAATPYGLFASSRNGLFRAGEGGGARLSLGGRAVAWSDPILLLTDQSTLRIRRPTAGSPETWKSIEYPNFLPEIVFETVVGDEGFWLVTMGTRTLYRLTFPRGFETEPELTPFEMTAPWPRPLQLKEGLRWVDRDRVLAFDSRTSGMVVDPRFDIAAWRSPGVDRMELKATGDGEIWLGMRDRVVRLDRSADGSFSPGSRSFSLPSQLTFDMQPDPDHGHILWLSTELGPIRFDTRREIRAEVRPTIRFLPPENRLRLARGGGFKTVLGSGPEPLRFEVGVPFFLEEGLNEYRYMLSGSEDGRWTPWTRESVKEFTHLPGSDYRFRVEARNGSRALGSASLSFRVLPQWYQTWWARIGLLLSVAGVALIYWRSQHRRLQRERSLWEKERAIRRRLTNLDALKDEFLVGTSFELRAPLHGIAEIADSLIDGARGSLPRGARQDLSVLVSGTRRLTTLVDDILDFSRLKHKNLELRRRPVDLKPLVDVVLALNQPLVDPARVRLISLIKDDLPPVDADENRLQQILHNLLRNALKLTDQGTIEVSAERRNETVWVRVRDTGRPIPEAERESIFTAFEDLEEEKEGLERRGLGLALSRRLVELHGGSLWLESSGVQGSTFTFSLPISRQSFTDPVILPSPERVEKGRTERREVSDPESARILVVDDDPMGMLIYSNHLASWGYEVIEARNGKKALESIEQESVDLVLLDVVMPRMSGFEVCRRIREKSSLHELPVIFLTAKEKADDLSSGYTVGANDYLVKPVSKHELRSRVETHLELSMMHRHLGRLVDERTAQLTTLRGLLPICASCKKIRDDQGYWSEIESYIRKHSEAEFSHGFCPGCYEKMCAQIEAEKEMF